MVAVSAQPPDLRRRSLGREGVAVACPLARLGNASDPVRVPRLADALPVSFSRLLTVAAVRLAWVATTNSPEDLHLQVTIHAGHTRQKPQRIARALVAKELAKSVSIVLHDQVDFNQQFKGTPLTRQKHARWPRRASPAASLNSSRAPARDWEARRSCRG
jgi:hypothetical protein